jgi:hypothetical protein
MKTYITKAERTRLIDSYLDCWMETESYVLSDDETPEMAEARYRTTLESMNNVQLVEELESAGWDL